MTHILDPIFKAILTWYLLKHIMFNLTEHEVTSTWKRELCTLKRELCALEIPRSSVWCQRFFGLGS